MNEEIANFVSILSGYEQSKIFDEDKIFLFSESLDRTFIGERQYMAPEMTMMIEESMKEIQKNIAPKISKNGAEIIHYMQYKI